MERVNQTSFSPSLSISKHLNYLHLHHRLTFFLHILNHPSKDTLTTPLLPSCWNPSGRIAQSGLQFGWRWSDGVNAIPFAKLPARTYAQASHFCCFHHAVPDKQNSQWHLVGWAKGIKQAYDGGSNTKKQWCLVKGGCIIYFNAAVSGRNWAGVTMATGCWEIAKRESSGWSQWAFSFLKPAKINSEQNPKARTTCSFLTAPDVGGGGSGNRKRPGL